MEVFNEISFTKKRARNIGQVHVSLHLNVARSVTFGRLCNHNFDIEIPNE